MHIVGCGTVQKPSDHTLKSLQDLRPPEVIGSDPTQIQVTINCQAHDRLYRQWSFDHGTSSLSEGNAFPLFCMKVKRSSRNSFLLGSLSSSYNCRGERERTQFSVSASSQRNCVLKTADRKTSAQGGFTRAGQIHKTGR